MTTFEERVKAHQKEMKKSKGISMNEHFAKMASKGHNPFSMVTHINGKSISSKRGTSDGYLTKKGETKKSAYGSKQGNWQKVHPLDR